MDIEDALANIDGYLDCWDRFACGENDLVPFLNEYREPFESLLASCVLTNYPWAASRVVFYALVQVGGAIPVQTDLGKAWLHFTDLAFPITQCQNGERVFFAADFYRWWLNNRGKYPNYLLLDD